MSNIKTKLSLASLFRFFAALWVALVFGAATLPAPALAKETCGSGENKVEISVNVDCSGSGNPIFDYARGFLAFLGAGVGLVIVGAIVVGGILYASARGDKSQVETAKDIIRNAIIALILFILMAAIVNFMIPGGLFN